jgi:opacity protein-like surface antigen
MGSLRALAIAGAAAVMTLPAARAADLPPIIQRAMPVVADDFASGWYLRGDVGVGMQRFSDFDFTQTNPSPGVVWPASWRIDQRDIKDTAFVGFGFGYQLGGWLRFDATGEYRTSSKGKAVGSYAGAADFCFGGRCFDLYDFDHQASVFLANAYLDLGTWWYFTPFVGVGAGAVRHNISALHDVGFDGLGGSSFGFANKDRVTWDFAWAVHAGVAYNVTTNVKLEFAYRYLNMGSPLTVEVDCGGVTGGCGIGGGPRAFYTLTDFDSHDFKLGMRWMFSEPPAPPPVYAPPLIRKG